MTSNQFSSMKSKDKLLSLILLGLLVFTLLGCPWQRRPGGDGDLKSGGESGAVVVIRTEDPAPGVSGTQVEKLSSLCLNNSGQVAFKATLAGDGVTDGNNEGLWMGTPEFLALVAREGMVAPGIAGRNFGKTMFPSEPPLLNNNGQLAFRAGFTPGSTTDPVPEGIWVGTADSLELAARSGAAAPGVDPSQFTRFSHLRLNKAGQIAFIAALRGATITTDNDIGIWSGSPGNLSLVIRKGLATTSTQYAIVSTDRPASPTPILPVSK